MQGQIIEAALSVYTEPMGYWFFVLMLALINIVIFVKTENTTAPLIITLFASGIMMFYAPGGAGGISEMLLVSQALFVLAAAGIIWKVWKGK